MVMRSCMEYSNQGHRILRKCVNNGEAGENRRILKKNRHNKAMKSIRLKLVLAFLLTTSITVAGMLAFVQWSFDRGFIDYVHAQELSQLEPLNTALAELYAADGNWDSLRQNHRQWRELHRQTLGTQQNGDRAPPDFRDRPPPHDGGPQRDRPPPPGIDRGAPGGPRDQLPARIALFDKDYQRIAGNRSMSATAESSSGDNAVGLQAIMVADQAIGYLGLQQSREIENRLDRGFVESQNRTLLLISLVMMGLAMLISIPLAGQLVQPIKSLLKATRELTAGQYQTRTLVTSQDELGQLTADFNSLAATLESNEQARKVWVSDISHELRTPLAVLKAQIEALLDGIHTPNAEVLQTLNNKVNHISGLVDDLYQLSLSDMGALQYRKQQLAFKPLVEDGVAGFESSFAEKGITLTLALDGLPDDSLFGDPDRLQQLLGNLLTNSLRYTDSPGQLTITARRHDSAIEVSFCDSAPGVNEQDLPNLFNRLFRVDKSRARASGGAGLGLSLCKSIVTAHHGSIAASASAEGGLCIKFTLRDNEV